MNRFPKEKFEQVAAENGYEVFTPDQIASYYKEGIQKSLNDQMSEAEKKEFVADCMYLSKAVLVDKDGAESTVFFRKSQVDWEKAEDGTIMKGVAGVYADTPANRLLERVGEAYIPDADFMKSLDGEENEIAKAARTGRYADTPENRRLHRVGQPYKKRASKGGQEGEEKPAGKKNEGGKLDEKTLKDAWASIRTIDEDTTWDYTIREHFGDEKADACYDEDGELKPEKMLALVKKLPVDVVKQCIKEVGMEPEDGDQPMPGESGSKSDGKKDGSSLSKHTAAEYDTAAEGSEFNFYSKNGQVGGVYRKDGKWIYFEGSNGAKKEVSSKQVEDLVKKYDTTEGLSLNGKLTLDPEGLLNKHGNLDYNKWHENVKVGDLPKKYRFFTYGAIANLKDKFDATSIQIAAYVSDKRGFKDDTQIVVDGKIDGKKFEINFEPDGSGSIGVGSNSAEFKNTRELVSKLKELRPDMDWESDIDDDSKKKKSE